MKQMYLKYKNILTINAVLLAFLAVLVWMKPIDGLRKYYIYNHSGEAQNEFIPVYGDISVEQRFTCGERADSFEIYVAPVNKEYHGSFRVRLSGKDDSIIGDWVTDKLDIADGWVQYRLRGSILEPGKEYRLEIMAPDMDEFGAIGVDVFVPEYGVSGVGDLIYNGQADYVGKTMSLGVYKRQTNIFAILAIICLFGTLNICWFMKDKGTKKLALPILIGSGLIMLLILAPGCGPDDEYHYYSSFGLSNMLMLRSNVNEIERKYESDLPMHHNTNVALVETYEGLRYRIKGDEKTYMYDGNMSNLKWPVTYFAQAAGITAGRILHMNFIKIYTLGRLFNLIGYIALATAAVRFSPVNKELMLMMAIMPMSMQQATQLSYDMPVNGLSLLFTAYILKLVYDKKEFGWKNTLICTVLLVAVSPIKIIYILSGVLLLMIPANCFRSKADRLVKLTVPIISAITAVLLTIDYGKVRSTALSGSVGTSGETMHKLGRYSFQFALNNPVRFIRLLLVNGESHLSNMIKGMIGGELAGFSLGIPEQLVMLFLLCLLACAVAEKEKIISTKWQMLVAIGLSVAGYFAVLALFAFAETVYGTIYIGGTQGRYLTPFIFSAMYCLCGRKININIDRLLLFIPICFIEAGYIVEVMSNIDF